MSGKTNSNGLRDVIVIIGVLAVFGITYLVFRQPTVVPVPPGQAANVGGHQSMGGMDQLPNLPSDYNGLVGIGNQSYDQGNYSMAAECYRRALEIKGEDSNVRTDFGACLSFMGLPQRALEEFRKVINGDSEHAMSRFNAGIVHNGLHQTDSAIYYFEKYLAMDPNGKAAGQVKSIMEKLKNSSE